MTRSRHCFHVTQVASKSWGYYLQLSRITLHQLFEFLSSVREVFKKKLFSTNLYISGVTATNGGVNFIVHILSKNDGGSYSKFKIQRFENFFEHEGRKYVTCSSHNQPQLYSSKRTSPNDVMEYHLFRTAVVAASLAVAAGQYSSSVGLEGAALNDLANALPALQTIGRLCQYESMMYQSSRITKLTRICETSRNRK